MSETHEISTCSHCGKKLHRPLRVKDGYQVSCGVCYTRKLNGNSYEMEEISNSNLQMWT